MEIESYSKRKLINNTNNNQQKSKGSKFYEFMVQDHNISSNYLKIFIFPEIITIKSNFPDV